MLGYYKLSLIGLTHQAKEDGICQDASDVAILDNGWIVAAIADGLGSAKKSDIGATTAVKTVLSFVSENYPNKWHEESLISLIRTAYHKAFRTIKALSDENQDDLCDYDTTLTTVIYNGTNAVYGHVGDGGVIVLSSYGEFSKLTEAQKGDAFNETCPLRSGPDSWSFGVSRDDVCAITMMTDGIFDIACPWLLARADQPIYVNYVRPFMDTNILRVSTPADFENAQKEIIEFFEGDYSKQIIDDKTIVGIINTDIVPEIKQDEYYKEPNWEALSKEHHDKLYGKTGATKLEESSLSFESLMDDVTLSNDEIIGKTDNNDHADEGESETEEEKTQSIESQIEINSEDNVDKDKNQKKGFLRRIFRVH